MHLDIQVKDYESRKAKAIYNLEWRNGTRSYERKDGW
jgi:hypothetical protein